MGEGGKGTNLWKEENANDSKDSGFADLTASSLVAGRDGYRATTMLASCDV
jgi:hypothetical protein